MPFRAACLCLQNSVSRSGERRPTRDYGVSLRVIVESGCGRSSRSPTAPVSPKCLIATASSVLPRSSFASASGSYFVSGHSLRNVPGEYESDGGADHGREATPSITEFAPTRSAPFISKLGLGRNVSHDAQAPTLMWASSKSVRNYICCHSPALRCKRLSARRGIFDRAAVRRAVEQYQEPVELRILLQQKQPIPLAVDGVDQFGNWR